MISIIWYSFCNFIAGFSPTFMFLFVFRALLGIGMGAEWPAGPSVWSGGLHLVTNDRMRHVSSSRYAGPENLAGRGFGWPHPSWET